MINVIAIYTQTRSLPTALHKLLLSGHRISVRFRHRPVSAREAAGLWQVSSNIDRVFGTYSLHITSSVKSWGGKKVFFSTLNFCRSRFCPASLFRGGCRYRIACGIRACIIHTAQATQGWELTTGICFHDSSLHIGLYSAAASRCLWWYFLLSEQASMLVTLD